MSNLENNSNFQQNRESRYQSIFESASVGILNMKRDGGFIQANPYFCNFIGFSEEQLLKMNILGNSWFRYETPPIFNSKNRFESTGKNRWHIRLAA